MRVVMQYLVWVSSIQSTRPRYVLGAIGRYTQSYELSRGRELRANLIRTSLMALVAERYCSFCKTTLI
jgi:hypothetical protein